MWHYADSADASQDRFRQGSAVVMISEAGDRTVLPSPLESPSAQVFMLASPRIAEGSLLSQAQLTGVFNWELVLASLICSLEFPAGANWGISGQV